jgi:VanZ family protein
MNQKKAKIFIWLLPLAVAAAIFCFSAQPADESSALSNGVVELLIRWLSVLNANLDSEALLAALSYPVRKAAHMTEFTVLYGSLTFAFHVWQVRGRRMALYAMAITFLYACSDEFHQLFVPGRAGRFTDVLIDCTVAGLITIIICIRTNKGAGSQGN